jgi:hypothetical protein
VNSVKRPGTPDNQNPARRIFVSAADLNERRPYASHTPRNDRDITLVLPPRREYASRVERGRRGRGIPFGVVVDAPANDVDSNGADLGNSSSVSAFYTIEDNMHIADVQREKNRRKKSRQYVKWNEEVIPSLIPDYLRVMRQSRSLRDSLTSYTLPCDCDGLNLKSIDVSCVYFDSKLS